MTHPLDEYLSAVDPAALGASTLGGWRLCDTHAGESNVVYHIKIGALSVALKCNAITAKDPTFFANEFHKLVALRPLGFAPHPYALDTLHPPRFMLLEYVPGKAAPLEGFADLWRPLRTLLQRMATVDADALRRTSAFACQWHSCEDFARVFPERASQLLARYREQGGDDTLVASVQRAIEASRAMLASHSSALSAPVRLIHTGIHPGNVVVQSDGIRLIDWEHACIGDPAFELSALVRHTSFAPSVFDAMCAVYGDAACRSRITLYTELFKVHEVLWHALRLLATERGEVRLGLHATAEAYRARLTSHIAALQRSCLLTAVGGQP